MRFALSDDQVALADAVSDLLGNEADAERVRTAWSSDSGEIDGVWERLTEMGVPGLLAPERLGGVGFGPVEMAAVAHRAGRAALPGQMIETAAVAVPVLSAAGRDEDVGEICSGGLRFGVAFGPDRLVPLGTDRTLLAGQSQVVIVDTDALDVESVVAVDGARRVGRLPERAGDLADNAWDGSAPIGDAELARLLVRFHGVAAAAELCGLADTMVAMAAAYATERHQFGVPIGSFQAVKHHLANALVAAEFARPPVWAAAAALERSSNAQAHNAAGDADVAAHFAKAAAAEAAQQVAKLALQTHGAIAYTVEYDLHLYMKRAWALSRKGGDARWHRRHLARHLFEPGDTGSVVENGAPG